MMKKALKMAELKKLLKKKIDDFEYYNSGMKWANGGFAEVKKLSVEKERDDDDKVIGYVVHASVVVGDFEQETLYRDCEYHFDMKLNFQQEKCRYV